MGLVRFVPEAAMTYFHGGLAGRQRGTFLLPPNITRVRSLSEFGASAVHRRDRVYVTTAFEAALLYAASARNGMVYQVEPLGHIEADPDCDMPGLSWQCEKACVLRIIKPTRQMIEMAQSVLLGTKS